jgi:hypothetical protein
MFQLFTRWAALASTAAALALTSAGAFAQATITLTDSNCSGFALGGTAPNQTLTCVVSSAPLCTVSGPSSGTNGTPITLSASCSPFATSWTWTGGNCAGVTISTCAAAELSPVTRQYTVAGTNGSFIGSASPVKSVVWSNTPPPPPTGCTIAQQPTGTLPVGGGSVTLTASCSGGTGISWSWAGGFAQGAISAQVTGTVSATTAFTAIATNGGGTMNATLTVNVATGGGGGGGAISCSGFNKTIPGVANWAVPTRMFSGSFGGNDAWVVPFTTGSGTAPGKLGSIVGAEYLSSPSAKVATLSTTPCDFGATLGAYSTATGKTISLLFSVGGDPAYGLYPVLQPSTTYYVNIKNVEPCEICDMFLDFTKPRGL